MLLGVHGYNADSLYYNINLLMIRNYILILYKTIKVRMVELIYFLWNATNIIIILALNETFLDRNLIVTLKPFIVQLI